MIFKGISYYKNNSDTYQGEYPKKGIY